MAEDYYSILEVPRSATQDEIQKAYRRLARKYHPDLQGDSKTAKQKFQQIQSAYDVLGDEEKRRQYDRFGPDFERMRGAPFGSGGGPFPGGEVDFSQIFGGQMPEGAEGGGGLEELLRQFGFARGGRPRRGAGARGRGQSPPDEPPPPPSLDLQQEVTVPFATAVLGGQYQLHPEHGRQQESLSVRIPAGIESGKRIRLRGQGRTGPDGSRGDLFVTVRVAPHPVYRRTGDNLLVRLPITMAEAIRGTSVDLPTPHGTVTLKVPPRCSSGRVLRLKGMGVRAEGRPAGDLLAEVEIVLPADLSESAARDALAALDRWPGDDPRAELMW